MLSKIKIGVVGIGMVGAQVANWFLEQGFKRGKNLFCYDKFKKEFSDDVMRADLVFICVNTPSCKDGSCDISIVEEVVKQFAGTDKVLVLKSTVLPGTCEKLSKKYKIRFFLFNPEYLTEAQAREDFIKPDRQIIAPANEESKQFCNFLLTLLPVSFFSCPGVEGTYKFYSATSTEAELAKYGGNIFGAIKVTFANILADFCDVLGVDYENVKGIVGHDRRIGMAWLDVHHGKYRGFGGFCFPKDMAAFIAFAEILVGKLRNKKKKEHLQKGLAVFKAVWDYNESLLASQGLTTEDVSIHDDDLKKKLKGDRND